MVDEETLERYEIGLQKLPKTIDFNIPFWISFGKFFQIMFYDILIILYLFKPLKKPTTEETKIIKKLQQELINTRNANETAKLADLKKNENVQNISKKMEQILAPKRRLYINLIGDYLRTCWSMNFIASILSALVYFASVVSYFLLK